MIMISCHIGSFFCTRCEPTNGFARVS